MLSELWNYQAWSSRKDNFFFTIKSWKKYKKQKSGQVVSWEGKKFRFFNSIKESELRSKKEMFYKKNDKMSPKNEFFLVFFFELLDPVPLFIQTASFHHNFGDLVRIAIWGWSSIFKITAFLLSDIPRNTDGTSSVSYTSREIVNGRGFMKTGQTTFVVFS